MDCGSGVARKIEVNDIYKAMGFYYSHGFFCFVSRSLSENYNRNEKVINREQIFRYLRRIAADTASLLFNNNSRKFGPILSISKSTLICSRFGILRQAPI